MQETTQEPTAKQRLYAQGWTISSAAAQLGVSRGHLNQVLAGERVSARLIKRVAALPYKRLTRLKRSK